MSTRSLCAGAAAAWFALGCSASEPASSGDEADGPTDAAPLDRAARSEGDTPQGPVELFNGRDFAGWDTYLGPPNGSAQPVGLNQDPRGVFSILTVDGAPAIRISGEIWGGLVTVAEFENYHLRLEFKWGTHAVWPPLIFRDSGLLYHSVGPFGAVQQGGGGLADPPGTGSFMTSMELQIAEGDVGSYYSLGPIVIEKGPYASPASMQYENPVGAWNTIDVFAVGNESLHVINGHPVVHVGGAMIVRPEDGSQAPLTRGKIQLQSESMEVFFRSITLEPIESLPAGLLP